MLGWVRTRVLTTGSRRAGLRHRIGVDGVQHRARRVVPAPEGTPPPAAAAAAAARSDVARAAHEPAGGGARACVDERRNMEPIESI